jgi:hypothetical protein
MSAPTEAEIREAVQAALMNSRGVETGARDSWPCGTVREFGPTSSA